MEQDTESKLSKNKENISSKIKNLNLPKKIKFKLPPTLVLLLILIMFVVFLTWVIPSGFYQEVPESDINQKFYEAGYNQFGILDVFWSTGQGMVGAADLIFYLFMSGAFFHSIIKTGALESGIGSLLKKTEGKEIILIPVTMILFSLPGTISGFSEETIVFYTLLVPVFVVAGFDVMTGFLTIFLGAGIGVMNSTTNPFLIGIAVESSNNTSISSGDGIVFRVVSYILMLSIAIAFVMFYAKKVKNNPEKSILSKEERKAHSDDAAKEFHLDHMPEFTTRKKIIIGVFAFAMFMILIVNLPWADWGVNFSGWGETVNEEAPWFTKMIPGFGEWGFIELGVLVFMLSIVVNMISGNDSKKSMDIIIEGMESMLSVAIIISFARGISVIMDGSTLEGSVSVDVNGLFDNELESMAFLTETFSETFASDFDTHMIGSLENMEKLFELELLFDESGAVSGYEVYIDQQSGMSPYLLNGMTSGLDGANVSELNILNFFILLPLSIMNPSSSAVGTMAFPILGPMSNNLGGPDANVGAVTAFAFAMGLANLLTPTSGVLMGGLALSKITLNQYYKTVWPLLFGLFITSIVLLGIGGIPVGDGYLIGI